MVYICFKITIHMMKVYVSDASRRGEIPRKFVTEQPDNSRQVLQSPLFPADTRINPFGNFCKRKDYCGRCQYNCINRRPESVG